MCVCLNHIDAAVYSGRVRKKTHELYCRNKTLWRQKTKIVKKIVKEILHILLRHWIINNKRLSVFVLFYLYSASTTCIWRTASLMIIQNDKFVALLQVIYSRSTWSCGRCCCVLTQAHELNTNLVTNTTQTITTTRTHHTPISSTHFDQHPSWITRIWNASINSSTAHTHHTYAHTDTYFSEMYVSFCATSSYAPMCVSSPRVV